MQREMETWKSVKEKTENILEWKNTLKPIWKTNTQLLDSNNDKQ